MNKERALKWADALESGEYEQGTGTLRAGDQYCCLGVLCDLYHRETGDGRWAAHLNSAVNLYTFITDGSSASGYDPQKVRNWIDPDRESRDGFIQGQLTAKQGRFANLNDNKAMSFKEIAAIIRKEVE